MRYRLFVLGCLSLFVLLLIAVGVFFRWYVRYQAVIQQREEYERELAQYEMGLVDRMVLCWASAELCKAEESVPFSSAAYAQALHVVRLYDIEMKARSAIDTMDYGEGGREAALNELHKITDFRVRAKERLDELLRRKEDRCASPTNLGGVETGTQLVLTSWGAL